MGTTAQQSATKKSAPKRFASFCKSPWLRIDLLAIGLWVGYIVAWHPWLRRDPRVEALPGADLAYFILAVAARSDPFQNLWWDLSVGVIEISLIVIGVASVFNGFRARHRVANQNPQGRSQAFQISVVLLLLALSSSLHQLADRTNAALLQIKDDTSDISGITNALSDQGEKLSGIEDVLKDIEVNTEPR